MSAGVENTILAFVVIAALALAVQTIGMIALLLVARKAAKNMREELEHYRSSVSPLLLRARDVVQHVAPKVEQAADELAVITAKLREQTAEVQVAANDIIARTQHQVGRVDSMLTTVFDRVERAGVFMSDAVARPMRQLSGLIASVRAAVDSLREPATINQRPPQSAHRYPDVEPAEAAHRAEAGTPTRP